MQVKNCQSRGKTVTSTLRDGIEPSSRTDSQQLRATLHTGVSSRTVCQVYCAQVVFSVGLFVGSSVIDETVASVPLLLPLLASEPANTIVV